MTAMASWQLAAAVLGAVLLSAASASADMAPPPPDCSADTLAEACSVWFDDAPTVNGVCMLGVDDAYYCRVGSNCYAAVQPGPTNVARTCPAEAAPGTGGSGSSAQTGGTGTTTTATSDVSDEDGCALRAPGRFASAAGASSLLAAAVAAGALRRRRRARRNRSTRR